MMSANFLELSDGKASHGLGIPQLLEMIAAKTRYFKVILHVYFCPRKNMAKISKGVGIMARFRHFVPTTTLIRIYRSLIEPFRPFLMVLLPGAKLQIIIVI